MDQQVLHDQVLYPVVRVRAKGVGGSGVLVYSQPNPKATEKYINLLFTCQHVIDSLIEVKEEWNPILQRDMKREFFTEATVEVFDYDDSQVVSSNATQADVIAYDKRHDVAMLRLHNPRKMPYIASLLPRDAIPMLHIGDGVTVCGCSLLHDPFPNHGTLTYLREVIDQKAYLMVNAPSIFGNSGGGLFHESGHLLGLTSRITALQLGFGVDIMTWMGFSTHPDRMYEFLDEQELKFIYDPMDDYHAAMERRKQRKEEALRQLLIGGSHTPVVPEQPPKDEPKPA